VLEASKLRSEYADAVRLMKNGECEKAVVLFRRSHEQGGYKNALWNMAECYRKLVRPSLAVMALRKFLQHPRTAPEERRQAEDELRELSTRTAQLEIKVNPAGAAVVIDGDVVGQSPLGRVVDPGSHTVEISSPGYAAQRVQLDLEPGKPRLVALTLSLSPARLILSARPAGAQLLVADGVVGLAPATVRVSPGAMVVEARKDGFRPRRRQVSVAPGEHLNVHFDLDPTVAQLAVNVDSPRARVAVDGVTVGEGPVGPTRLTPGKHQVSVTQAGFAGWSGTLDLKDLEAATIEIRLRRGRLSPAWFAGAAAVAVGGLVGGGILVAQARSQVNEFDRIRTALQEAAVASGQIDAMKARARQLASSSDTRYAAGTALLAVGGAATVGAGVLALFTRWGRSEGRILIGPGPGLSVAAAGSFE
jgi:hypothetical protein